MPRMKKERHALRDKVVVYVPWSTFWDHRPYWEGTVVAIIESVEWGRQYKVQKDGFEPCDFHERFVFPEKLRGRVRATGDPPRLVVSR